MNTRSHRFLRLGLIGLCLVSLSACSNMNSTQQSTLSGAAIGAGVGTVGTVLTGGCITCGAVVGGVVGAGTGYVLDKVSK